ncbi:hypothetical protein BHF71_02965 [Vulcanibacillus modesticaldus]|uniref:Uncharacterized protein n=1 Tax=Vulcanibacillus modesticaldus TaxID=337097 RepID=A0A1D2YT96_9BACI|nr:hypothetical protein [Vulcanibacillus modesticaldus]OEF98903.1 hypothetical protein BHF71_02965 [Vulcanibacillus modesticaldus]
MSTTLVFKVRSAQHKKDIISVPKNIYNQLTKSEYVILKIGQFEKKVVCLVNKTVNKVIIPHSFLNEIEIPEGTETNILIKDNTIRFGPVIGVFIRRSYARSLLKQKMSFRTKETISANHEVKTIFYYFCDLDVDFSQNKINGIFLMHKKVFLKEEFYHFQMFCTIKGQEMQLIAK